MENEEEVIDTGSQTPEVVAWKTVEEKNENEVVPVVEQVINEQIAEIPIEVVAEEQPKEFQAEIDESTVLNFLKGKGFDAESLEDLKPREVKKLTPEIEKFLEFQEQTNNTNFADFLETQREWDKADPNDVLRHVIKVENPSLTDDEREYIFKKRYSIDGLDEDFDDDKDKILEKGITAKVDYQKGLELLESQKEKYKVARGSDEFIPEDYKNAKKTIDDWRIQQEENKKFIEQNRADFVAKTENVFSNNFEGFKVKVGESEFKVKPEDVQIAKNTLSDLSNFDKKFFDENQQLKDPQEYYKALYFAMNPDKVAEHFINIGKSLQAEADELESKNITVDGNKHVANNFNPNASAWKVVK